MPARKIRWYVKAQLGILLLPAGLCLFGEAIVRRSLQLVAGLALARPAGGAVQDAGPWFWHGSLGLILITAGVALMIESGMIRGYPDGR